MGLGSGIRDPGSEIRDPEKTYSGSRIQGSKRHRIPDPQHCSMGEFIGGSIVNLWIRICIELAFVDPDRIGNADPDPGARKLT
jgi:hypothetical protein